MSDPISSHSAVLTDAGDPITRLAEWCRREPVGAALALAIFGVIAYFFGFYQVFVNGTQSAAEWAWRGWNSENDLKHGPLILPAAIFAVWWRREQLTAAPKSTSILGLIIAFIGAILFVLSARTLQPRVALVAFPVLAYGITRFLWGKQTSRIVIFPCAFLLFMIPAGFIVSRTEGLQSLTAIVAAKLSNLFGIGVIADGANIEAKDHSFHFEIAGGCSGIRSLTAMTVIAAQYVYYTQRELWKQLLIFGSSLAFALLGNFTRIFTVVLFARFINPEIAGGLYHDYSGFVFFPFAVGGMIGFARLLNRDWMAAAVDSGWEPVVPASSRQTSNASAQAMGEGKGSTQGAAAKPPASSYDY